MEFQETGTSTKYFGTQFRLEELFGRPVDLVTVRTLREELRPEVERDLKSAHVVTTCSMNILDTIAENKIQQAIERGELDFPEMYGKPVEITEDFSIPVEVRLMLRKLSQAKNTRHEQSLLLRFWKARANRAECKPIRKYPKRR